MIEMNTPLLALRYQQSSLIGSSRKRHLLVIKQPSRLRKRMAFQVGFELGQPNFHSAKPSAGERLYVFRKRGSHRGRFADARLHDKPHGNQTYQA
jgi:hypothetical protein